MQRRKWLYSLVVGLAQMALGLALLAGCIDEAKPPLPAATPTPGIGVLVKNGLWEVTLTNVYTTSSATDGSRSSDEDTYTAEEGYALLIVEGKFRYVGGMDGTPGASTPTPSGPPGSRGWIGSQGVAIIDEDGIIFAADGGGTPASGEDGLSNYCVYCDIKHSVSGDEPEDFGFVFVLSETAITRPFKFQFHDVPQIPFRVDSEATAGQGDAGAPTGQAIAGAVAPSKTPARKTATSTASPTSTPLPTDTPKPTATPTPTSTPPATPTPPPSGAMARRGNVREGPDTSYPIITSLPADTALNIIGAGKSVNWIKVLLADGREGWISGDLVRLDVPKETLPIGTYRPRSGVISRNMRSGPGQLTIVNQGSDDGLVILTLGEKDSPVLGLYVRATETFQVSNIPDGVYDVYFSEGSQWDGSTFIDARRLQRAEDPLFYETTYEGPVTYYQTWTLTLHTVFGGNISTEQIPPEEFPALP